MKSINLFLVILTAKVLTVFSFPNIKDLLPKAESCLGKCKQGYIPSDPCQCNSQCSTFGNCCADYVQVCTSCVDRCGLGVDQNYGCQCNSACANFNDCCSDYDSLCSGKPTITDQDLIDISEKIHGVDFNSVGYYVETDAQGKSTSCSADVASTNLFTYVNENLVSSRSTFNAFSQLMDNYKPDPRTVEDRTDDERAEEDWFLDIIMDTTLVMPTAMEFMKEKGLFSGTSEDFKNLLKEIWFGLYDRDGTSNDVLGSSGFEHVFIGEQREGKVLGFHNWYSFYMQEKLGSIDYLGYLDITDFGSTTGSGLSTVFTWNGMPKCIGSMPIGTSPELELALYTICFFARPESKCKMTLNHVPIIIQTFSMNYNGVKYVGTSYPDWR